MQMRLVFLKLELKRAWKRIPQVFAGAIVLLALAGAIALLSSRALYGEKAAGRIPVAVVLPEEDKLAKQVVSMIGSLDSVKSMCDFEYVTEQKGRGKLQRGEVCAVMQVPEGLVQGIMDGTNPPVEILFPENAALESRIFRELADAGAGILSSSQAGIYAGDELCRIYGAREAVPQLVSRLEQELNEIYLSYSLPREDYFRYRRVSAVGDMDPLQFYTASGFVLALLLLAVPASGYLLPWKPVMRRKLEMAGIGCVTRVGGQILGLGSLYAAVSLASGGMCAAFGGTVMEKTAVSGGRWQLVLSAAALVLVCMSAAAFSVLIFRAAGTLMGGVMLLFLVSVGQHFLAGGFVPSVFLPASVRAVSEAMPSAVLMEGTGMILTASWDPVSFGKLAALTVVCGLLAAALEGGRR